MEAIITVRPSPETRTKRLPKPKAVEIYIAELVAPDTLVCGRGMWRRTSDAIGDVIAVKAHKSRVLWLAVNIDSRLIVAPWDPLADGVGGYVVTGVDDDWKTLRVALMCGQAIGLGHVGVMKMKMRGRGR